MFHLIYVDHIEKSFEIKAVHSDYHRLKSVMDDWKHHVETPDPGDLRFDCVLEEVVDECVVYQYATTDFGLIASTLIVPEDKLESFDNIKIPEQYDYFYKNLKQHFSHEAEVTFR